MMKTLTFFCLLVSGAVPPVFGQGRDTAFAVHKLFRLKRSGGDGLLATGATAAAGTQYAQRPTGRATAQEVAQDALAGVAFTGVGLVQALRYSAEREAAVLKLYAEGWGVPPDIRRKLRRKHFRVTARDLIPGR